jgi:hypothetical protein
MPVLHPGSKARYLLPVLEILPELLEWLKSRKASAVRQTVPLFCVTLCKVAFLP